MFRKILQTAVVLASVVWASHALAAGPTTTIDAKAPILTMVNVLTPKDGNQQALIAQLQKALDTTLVHQPGFISGNVHKSLNSPHVVNYAQWADQASLEAFVAKLNAGEAPEMAKVFTMATPDYHPYTVVSIHKAQN